MILRNCEAWKLEDLEKAINEMFELAYEINEAKKEGEGYEEVVVSEPKYERLYEQITEVSCAFLRFRDAEKDLERIMREEEDAAREYMLRNANE